MTPDVMAHRSTNAPTTPSLHERLIALRRRCLLHAFSYRDRSYLLDPVSGLVFRTTPAVHAILEALVGGGDDHALIALLQADGGAAASLVSDLEALAAEGLFDRKALSTAALHRRAADRFLAHNPRKMMLLVSQTCNLRCVYCYAIDGNFPDVGRQMSIETAQAAIAFLAKRAGKRRNLTVTLFGGEPLVNFSMISALVPWAESWCRSIGKRIHFCITTNGTLLSDEIIAFLIDHRFSIMISLDGPKSVQDHNRPNVQGRGSFDAAAPRIRALLERHPYPDSIKVRATMTHQHHDVAALSEFFAAFGFRRIGLGANVGFAFGKGPFDLTVEDRNDIYTTTEKIIDEYALQAIRQYRPRAYNPLVSSLIAIHDLRDEFGPKVKIPCGVGRNDQGIDVDGNVYPCHRYVGMDAYKLGDIYRGIDRERLEAYYRSVFDAHRHCESCWATRWCSGQCSQYLSHASGHVYSPDNPTCDAIRRNVQRTIALYHELTEEGVDWERVRKELGD